MRGPKIGKIAIFALLQLLHKRSRAPFIRALFLAGFSKSGKSHKTAKSGCAHVRARVHSPLDNEGDCACTCAHMRKSMTTRVYSHACTCAHMRAGPAKTHCLRPLNRLNPDTSPPHNRHMYWSSSTIAPQRFLKLHRANLCVHVRASHSALAGPVKTRCPQPSKSLPEVTFGVRDTGTGSPHNRHMYWHSSCTASKHFLKLDRATLCVHVRA